MNPVLRASTASVLTVVFSFVSTVSGCKSAPAPAPQDQAAAPAQAAPVSAPTAPMSVDDLVAPIALYPDQLLAQILTASTNAQEVLDGGNWLLQNQNLKGDALTDAAKQAGFSPPMQYLMSFPQVVDNMCQQIDWTRQLGQDFQADQKGVMEAVQRKRVQAQQTGNLKSSPQMTVETKKAENGQPYVEIQPANPQVVYATTLPPPTTENRQALMRSGLSANPANRMDFIGKRRKASPKARLGQCLRRLPPKATTLPATARPIMAITTACSQPAMASALSPILRIIAPAVS